MSRGRGRGGSWQETDGGNEKSLIRDYLQSVKKTRAMKGMMKHLGASTCGSKEGKELQPSHRHARGLGRITARGELGTPVEVW